MAVKRSSVRELSKRIQVGEGVADELLVLSGGDIDMAENASLNARGLDQCKAAIIDKRFKRLEDGLDQCKTAIIDKHFKHLEDKVM